MHTIASTLRLHRGAVPTGRVGPHTTLRKLPQEAAARTRAGGLTGAKPAELPLTDELLRRLRESGL